MAQVEYVTGRCMYVAGDVLRKAGGFVYNASGTDRGWRPDTEDRLFFLGYKKRGRKTHTWYLLIRQDGSRVFLCRLDVGDTESELRVTYRSKLPDIVRILADWIARKENATVA